jgi:hypothetical protein
MPLPMNNNKHVVLMIAVQVPSAGTVAAMLELAVVVV